MRELLILSVGPHACEMADLVAQINAVEPTWDLRGFLVPEAQASLIGSQPIGGHAVVGTYADLPSHPEAHLAWAFGCGFREAPQDRLATIIAPGAVVASTARIGKGCVIYPHCYVGHSAR
ncbi:MAG: hypothetical protein HOH74_15120, partial [Gemmatimonadetes bacterium]|nr:hypothetical protein [Gemmatimonadota bacterium]